MVWQRATAIVAYIGSGGSLFLGSGYGKLSLLKLMKEHQAFTFVCMRVCVLFDLFTPPATIVNSFSFLFSAIAFVAGAGGDHAVMSKLE